MGMNYITPQCDYYLEPIQSFRVKRLWQNVRWTQFGVSLSSRDLTRYLADSRLIRHVTRWDLVRRELADDRYKRLYRPSLIDFSPTEKAERRLKVISGGMME